MPSREALIHLYKQTGPETLIEIILKEKTTPKLKKLSDPERNVILDNPDALLFAFLFLSDTLAHYEVQDINRTSYIRDTQGNPVFVDVFNSMQTQPQVETREDLKILRRTIAEHTKGNTRRNVIVR